MLHGKPAVFISYSERFKSRVAEPFRAHINGLGLHGVLVGEEPLPLARDSGPGAKVEHYLDSTQMFVALMTPDDELAGEWPEPHFRARQNVVDELGRASERATTSETQDPRVQARGRRAVLQCELHLRRARPR